MLFLTLSWAAQIVLNMLSLESLADLADAHRQALSARVREFSIGGQAFRFKSQPSIMGVITKAVQCDKADNTRVVESIKSSISRVVSFSSFFFLCFFFTSLDCFFHSRI